MLLMLIIICIGFFIAFFVFKTETPYSFTAGMVIIMLTIIISVIPIVSIYFNRLEDNFVYIIETEKEEKNL